MPSLPKGAFRYRDAFCAHTLGARDTQGSRGATVWWMPLVPVMLPVPWMSVGAGDDLTVSDARSKKDALGLEMTLMLEMPLESTVPEMLSVPEITLVPKFPPGAGNYISIPIFFFSTLSVSL
jgi:hypothetical protein